MISISVTVDATATRDFLVHVQGDLKDRRGLNAALGSRLADELQDHFRQRNKEPNKMQAPKTNFWESIAESTQVESISESGAVVAIAEKRFRIHLFGGTIKPTGGRQWLTIPLIKEVRGIRVRDYENKTGRKLFRLGHTNILAEKTEAAQGSGGRGKNNQGATVRGASGIRPVYALARSVTHKPDPRALPDTTKLLAALNEEAENWVKDNLTA